MATEQAFNEAKKALVKQIRLTRTAIQSYTEMDVEIYDARTGGCSSLLKIIRDKLEVATNVADEILEDVEGETNEIHKQARITEVERLKAEIIRAVKENEKKVKAAANLLLDTNGGGGADVVQPGVQNDTGAGAAAAAALLEGKKAKLQVVQKQVTVKARDLKNVVMKVPDPKTMKEAEVRAAIADAKDWVKKMDEIQKLTDSMEQEGAMMNIDVKTEMEFAEQMTEAVTGKIEALKIEDKLKGYYASAGTKPKETIVYPKPFEGIFGTNIYRWCKEFEDAVESAQIREDDKVRKLLEYLKMLYIKNC